MLLSLKQQYGVVEERLFCLLHKCRLIDHLFQIQCQVIIHGLLQNRQLAPKAAIAYFETGNLASARQLFDQILQPGTVLWNVMLKGYTEAGLHKDTLRLFSQMKRRDHILNLEIWLLLRSSSLGCRYGMSNLGILFYLAMPLGQILELVSGSLQSCLIGICSHGMG
ncbi:hypothetical protein KFK09_013529 [Dendrobium nobile]|uniref:Pentatricopeptide repeat-containing protein n=1 Tax=Dendrobium nobile TaxID=94219 RepID=A0A8T3B917_DENNO|nr:hypothetical protein KFK09_013529 [Dendrobium nobile]